MPDYGFGKKKMDFGEDELNFGRRRRARSSNFGEDMPELAFGKKRATKKVSKARAMQAFKAFYRRHCSVSTGRGNRFGGNPPLSQSMGFEFCSNGSGLLGPKSTGLFATACTK